ncbi:MAG: cytochrome P460 family protein [Sphingomonas sp.]
MALALAGCARSDGATSQPDGVARFTASGALAFPADYRSWTFVTAGHGMSYSPNASDAMTAPFDNVFVSPGADAAFRRTGHWPGGTMFVLEFRGGATKGSINLHGAFQSGEPQRIEVHLRDDRFNGGWGFFAFDGTGPAPLIGYQSSCYSCHRAHGAVDTTFVQFYPVQLPVAASKGTLSPAYRREVAR